MDIQNPIFARYELISCKQQSGESLDRYLRKLEQLSMDCDYQAVSAHSAGARPAEAPPRKLYVGPFIRKQSEP